MSSMSVRKNTPQLEETIHFSVHQISPIALRVAASKKEALGFAMSALSVHAVNLQGTGSGFGQA
jgi:hypothetical protein